MKLSEKVVAARSNSYLNELNSSQREAVETLDGPVLMLAGAGTGKTKALTCRLAHLITIGRAKPHEILAVTFTNKAAKEMRWRVGQLLGRSLEGMPWLGTFHAVSLKILRRIPELAGLKNNFSILGADDQVRLLKQLILTSNIDEKRWPARNLAAIIDQWKNRAWSPDNIPSSEVSAFNNLGVEMYSQYQARLQELNAVDFGDLLLHTIRVFQHNPNILREYQSLFRFLLVDEYQDTNIAQYMWLRLLADGHKNICCVGDDDQSIYGWRGAEVGNILRFEKDFPGAVVIRLEQNYRSTGHILAAAGSVISGNKNRLGKELWSDGENGEKVRLIGHWDGEEEARWISEEIEEIQNGRRGNVLFNLDEIAILVRASHQMRVLEDRFLTTGLPYRVIGGARFYERMEIRDAIAYFRIVMSKDDDLALERIINKPKRGVGDKAQQKIQTIARAEKISLEAAADFVIKTKLVSGKGARELENLLRLISSWRKMLWEEKLGQVELAETILDQSGYLEMLKNENTPEALGRFENLKELIKYLAEFENIEGFLEHISLVMENEKEDGVEKVSIMTLHAAKGLEFPVVFLPGWEDGLFPSQRSMDESGIKGLEEERRLAYVGITRARMICNISFAGNRSVFGKWQSALPSRFIDELSPKDVEILTSSGLYGGRSNGAAANSKLHQEAAKVDGYNSPGWKRLQSNNLTKSSSEPSKARPVSREHTMKTAFSIKEKVFHQKFGYGFIVAIEGDKLEIDFTKAGLKKVISKFVISSDDMSV